VIEVVCEKVPERPAGAVNRAEWQKRLKARLRVCACKKLVRGSVGDRGRMREAVKT